MTVTLHLHAKTPRTRIRIAVYLFFFSAQVTSEKMQERIARWLGDWCARGVKITFKETT